MRVLVRLMFFGGWALLAAALWQRHDLPPPERLLPALQAEPQQVRVEQPPLGTTVGGITYTVKPLYSYELHGLVVSLHDTSSWLNYIHREWNDKLNVVDFCVIWGKNAASGVYRRLEFSSGQFVCYVQAPTQEVFAAFDGTALSNNHVLTDSPAVAERLRSVRIGDQIRLRGWLAEYSHRHNGQSFQRGTSTVRNDTGNGACETVFVQDFEILRRGGAPWHTLAWVAWLMIAAGTVGWFCLPLHPRR